MWGGHGCSCDDSGSHLGVTTIMLDWYAVPPATGATHTLSVGPTQSDSYEIYTALQLTLSSSLQITKKIEEENISR